MSKRKTRFIMVASALLTATMLSAQNDSEYMAYKDANLNSEVRAIDLLNRLTLEEKVSLMQNDSKAIDRLGIKPYEWWNEALHGVARAGLATVFPQAVGVAATFDDEAVLRMFNAISDEARAKNRRFTEMGRFDRYDGLTFWTPNINIFRDPRWGRGQETYGEDPYLTSMMGLAAVNGLQGTSTTKYDKTHACAKHFAVHSGPEWCRHSFDAKDISPRDLRETYLPAFQVLVQKGHVKEVMCAYNRYEGEPCCGSNRLLTQILRNEWGYDGLVVSDCWALNDFYTEGLHHTHETQEEAVAAAVLSGTDLECGPNYAALAEAVREGLVDESVIDISVRRLLKARFDLGIMDDVDPFPNINYSCVASDAHGKIALEIARKSIVLLQNKKNTLPLNKKMTIAVVGPNANDSVMQWGNYNGTPLRTSTILKALQERLGKDHVIYEPLCGLTDNVVLNSLWNSCSNDGKPGFSVRYWNNTECQGATVATGQATIPVKFSTQGATAVAAGVNISNFSIEYKAQFKPDHNGKATISFSNHGIVVLHIDGKEVFRSAKVWRERGRQAYDLDFKAGSSYDITLQYLGSEGQSDLDFNITEESTSDFALDAKRLKKADAIIFCGGLSPRLEGEEMPVNADGFKGGDRTDIQLPAVQRQMIKNLASLGKKLIFINFSGSAVALQPETERCGAIVQAWYPGQEGGEALADVILGDYNPSGRLPITFYTGINQLPDFLDYSMKGRTYRYMTEKPLFAFGHGLSYTTFQWGVARLSSNAICYGDALKLTVDIKNTGKRDGDEVLQIYVKKKDSDGPTKTLRAFKRVHIKAGTSSTVDISLPFESFQWFDEASGKMKVTTGVYEIFYGSSSDDASLQKTEVSVN